MSEVKMKKLDRFKTKSAIITLVVGLMLAILIAFLTYTSIETANYNEEHHLPVMVTSHELSSYTVTLNIEVVDEVNNTYPVGTKFHVFGLSYNFNTDEPVFMLIYVPEGDSDSNNHMIVTEVNYSNVDSSTSFTYEVDKIKTELSKLNDQRVKVTRRNTVVRVIITVVVFAAVMAFSIMLASISNKKQGKLLAGIFFALCLLVAFIIFMAAPVPCR